MRIYYSGKVLILKRRVSCVSFSSKTYPLVSWLVEVCVLCVKRAMNNKTLYGHSFVPKISLREECGCYLFRTFIPRLFGKTLIFSFSLPLSRAKCPYNSANADLHACLQNAVFAFKRISYVKKTSHLFSGG